MTSSLLYHSLQKKVFILLISVFTITNMVQAQGNDRPKVGLALSGGGAKGLAHLGVIEVLEEAGIPIDYIAGTSMGAVVGGLYAVGYNADSLSVVLHTIPWDKMYSDNVARPYEYFDQKRVNERYMFSLPLRNGKIGLPDGLIAGQRFMNELNTYTLPVQKSNNHFQHLALPFRCIATDLETGNAYVFKEGKLSTAIRASMSIPSIMKPLKHHSTKLVDGGISRNVPVEDLHDMGADIVIAVNVGEPLKSSEELNSMLEIMDQTVSFNIIESSENQLNLADVIITPKVGEYEATDFQRIDSLVYLGRKATQQQLSKIRQLTDPQKSSPPISSISEIPNDSRSFYITGLKLMGVTDQQKGQIERFLDIQLNQQYTLEDIKRDVSELYSTGLYELITFNITQRTQSSGYIYELTFTTKSEDLFQLGLRYNDVHKASFLFNLTLRDSFLNSSLFSTDLLVGNEYMLDLIYQKFRLVEPRLLMRVRSKGIRMSLPLYDRSRRVAELGINAANIQIELGSVFTRSISFTLTGKFEVFNVLPNIAPASFEEHTTYLTSVGTSLDFDNLNSVNFTENGSIFSARAEFSDNLILSRRDFLQLYGRLGTYISITDYMTFGTNVYTGFIDGEGIPVHYQFQFGGLHTSSILQWREHAFWGFNNRSVSNNAFKIANASLQFEFFNNRYLKAGYNIGTFNPIYNINLLEDEFVEGWMIQFGAQTAIGPLSVIFATGTQQSFMAGFNFGYAF